MYFSPVWKPGLYQLTLSSERRRPSVCQPVQPSMCHENKQNTLTSTFKTGGVNLSVILGLRVASCLLHPSKARFQQQVVNLQTGLFQFSLKATRNRILYKTRAPHFHFSPQKKSNIARKLRHLLHYFFYTLYGRKFKLPSVSQNQWRKHFQVRSNP